MRLLLFWAQLRRLRRENRALALRVEMLEREMEKERARNVTRENFLISQVLTAAGRYGLPNSVDPPKMQVDPGPLGMHKPPILTALQRAQVTAIEEEGLRLGKSPEEIRSMVDLVKRGEMIPRYEEAFD